MIGAEPKPKCSQRVGEALADSILFVPRIAYYAIRAARPIQSEEDAEAARLRIVVREQAVRVRQLEDAFDKERARAAKAVTQTSGETANVVSWITEFEARHGRKPQIPELQAEFPDVAKTTAWRRITGR